MRETLIEALERVTLPGAGHFLHQEAPEVVNEHLEAFLGRPASVG